MPISYSDLDAPDGQKDNMGGFTQQLFFAPVNDFLVIQTVVSNPTTFDQLVEIATAHTFKTGKCFLKGYCTMDRGKQDNKIQGDTDGKSFRIEGEFFLPGSLPKAHGFAAAAKNERFILLMEQIDSDSSGHLQVGTEMLPAKIDPEFTVATNASGVRGHVFKYYANTPRQYIYTGAVSTTPAP